MFDCDCSISRPGTADIKYHKIDDWLHPAAFLYYTWKAFLLAASFVVATVISKLKFHGNSTKQSTEHWQNFEDTPLGLEEPAFEMFDQWFCLSELGIYMESADFLIRLRFVGRFANLEIYPSVFLAFLLFWRWRRQLWSPADWPYAADFAFIQRARVPKPCGLCWLLEAHQCQHQFLRRIIERVVRLMMIYHFPHFFQLL